MHLKISGDKTIEVLYGKKLYKVRDNSIKEDGKKEYPIENYKGKYILSNSLKFKYKIHIE